MKEQLKQIVIYVLTLEARILLWRTKPKIVAITGSVGKTSSKDAIYTVLKQHLHARKSEKSFNSDIGVALTVLGLSNGWNNPYLWLKNIFDGAMHALFSAQYPEVLVLEMGVDRPGDMKRLTRWIKPDVTVVTLMPEVPVHVEYFASPAEVVEEKMQLVYALKKDGVLVYNNDDQRILPYLPDVLQRSVGFSRYSLSDFAASGDRVLYEEGVPVGMEFIVTHAQREYPVCVRGSLGVQHTYTYTAALAVATLFDIAVEDAVSALAQHQLPPGRMRILEGYNDTVLIDDTYNSSPVACEHAILSLAELKTSGRKIAVLGDMLELGQFSVHEHERIGALLAGRVDVLVTLGMRARKIAEGALEHGLSEKCVFQYDDINRAKVELKHMLQKGDVILLKASQGIHAENVVAFLLREPEKAESLLVRQDAFWKEK